MSKKDLKGERFGKLVALYPVGEQEQRNTPWYCKCDCGKFVVRKEESLIYGNTKSCGCNKSRLHDLTGKRFGFFTVIELDEIKNGVSKWKCKCDCGNIRSIYAGNLTRGMSKSCGCKKSEMLRKANINDLSGQKFGRLKVLRIHETKDGGDAYFECQCDCGKIVSARGQNLKNGTTKSCGCLRDEYIPKNKTHGMSKTRLFKIWCGIRQRCCNKNNHKYPIYGGRGIAVCNEWSEFAPFMEWAFQNGYNDKLTIDRIDVDGNYSPDNCRWITLKEQANNTRKTVFLTYKGETKSASEWSEVTGIKQNTLTGRKRKGWSDEKCIETPPEQYHHRERKV